MGRAVYTSAPGIKLKTNWIKLTSLWVKKSNFKIICAPSLMSLPLSWRNLVKRSLAHLWGCSASQCSQNQIQEIFWRFSLFDNALCFLLKSCLWVRASNLKLIFFPSLMPFSISRGNLVKWSLAYFGASSANQCTQNQI